MIPRLSKQFFALVLLTTSCISTIFTNPTPPHYEDDLVAAIILSHDLERVQRIITAHPNEVNAQDHQSKQTPLHDAAACTRNFFILLYLIQRGANVNATNADQETPLHWAVVKRNFAAVQYLMQNGTDVDACNLWKITPLYYAAYYCNLPILHYLIQHGANIDGHAQGRTPLYGASIVPRRRLRENTWIHNRFEMIKWLLKRHAFVGAKELQRLKEYYPILFVEPSIFTRIREDLLEVLQEAGLPAALENLIADFIIA